MLTSYRATLNIVLCVNKLASLANAESNFTEARSFGPNTQFLCNTGCIKKTEQILNRSQRREAAQSMKFLINIDCLGTYDIE